MNFSHRPNRALRVRPALRCCDQQALGQCFQVEPAIEAVGEGAEVSRCIFSESEAVVTAAEAGLEVSQHRIDPLQLGHILGFAPSHDCAFMGAASLGHGTKAGQAIRINGAACSQAFSGPICYGFKLEARHRAELDTQWVQFISEGDRSDKGHLVFRAAPDLAANALTTQIRIINLNFATERVERFTLSHGLHQLVVNQPSRWVAHTQLAFQGQRGQTGLGLTNEVDRQKPCRQRQLGRLKDRACNQRCLMSTSVALKYLVAFAVQNAMCRTTAGRTAKTIGPASTLQCRRAKCFGAKELEKLRHRQAGLKLNAVHCHDAAQRIERWVQITPLLAHHVS